MFVNRTLRLLKVNKVQPGEGRLIVAQHQKMPNETAGQAWTEEGLTRVPYRVFQTEDAYRSEQKLIFQGPSWHYLAQIGRAHV